MIAGRDRRAHVTPAAASRPANDDPPARAPLPVRALDPDEREPIMSRETVLVLVAGTAIGVALAVAVLPSVIPDLASTLLGAKPTAYGYLSRASGVVAYLALWFALVLRLWPASRSERLSRSEPTATSLSRFMSLLGLALVAFHGAILVGDQHHNLRLDHLFVPFASPYEPVWVGVGQVAGYLALLVVFSFSVRRFVGRRCWARLHAAGFVVFALSVAHGLGAGTDSRTPFMFAVYAVTCSVTIFLAIRRAILGLSRCAT